MDDLNITMEEYIRLEEEKAQSMAIFRHSNMANAHYGKMEYYEEEDATLSCEPTVSPLNENEIDFRISFDESDDEDYMVIFDENSFSYKIIYVDNLKMDSENKNDKVNMPSSPGPTISHSDDLDFFKDFENEFSAITYNDDLTSKLTEPSQWISRLEEEVQELRRSVVGLRGDVARSITDQGKFTTWMVSCMTQLMVASSHTYHAFDSTLVGSSQLPNQRRTRCRTGDASTSASQQPDL
ncbi:hypothetical protein Tco_1429336 [Tanacetum coccineum]